MAAAMLDPPMSSPARDRAARAALRDRAKGRGRAAFSVDLVAHPRVDHITSRDGAVFLGCSRFPACRRTRDVS